MVILASARSKNGVLIRLPTERWQHIVTSHPEIDPIDYSRVLDVIENPDSVLQGDTGELLAVKQKSGKEIWIVVPYREVNQDDGFVLTAYVTTDTKWLFKREIIWSKD